MKLWGISDPLFHDSDSDDFDSGLQIYVSVGSRFVGFVLKFRSPNIFTPIRNTRFKAHISGSKLTEVSVR